MSFTMNNSASLTLRNPQQVLDSLPALLGFTPSESVCILWIANGFIRLVQRVDIDPGEADHSIKVWAAEVVWTARHADAQGAVVVWISGAAVNKRLVGALLRELRTARIAVVDCITSDGATYFTSSTAGSRRWVYSPGDHWNLGDRKALGYGPNEDAACWPLVGPLAIGIEDEAISSLMSAPDSSNVGDKLDGPVILRALRDQGRRDGLLWWVTEEERIRCHVKDCLSALLPCVAHGFGADVAAVLAIAHWLDGDGARAAIAIERGAKDDANHRLVNLVGLALAQGIPPRVWYAAMSDLSYETCRGGVVPVELDREPV